MVLVSIILPCRNEEKTVGICIDKIKKVFSEEDIDGEIIVSDSSTDSSVKVAKKHGATVVKHDKKGYGIACLEGISVAKGNYIIIGDADNTYDFSEIPQFIKALKDSDLVVGSRLKGDMVPGAMPVLHRYIGNPFLSFMLNFLFKTKISDAHCGFRAFRRDILKKISLKTSGMEFASEMIILAAKNNLHMSEIPVSYGKRVGESKLSSFSDGWRHLRFMLMYSPTYLFFMPGFSLFLIGFFIMVPLLFGTITDTINGYDISIPLMFFGSLLSLLGYQLINLGLYARIYAIHTGFEKNDPLIDMIAEKLPLERGILFGVGTITFAFILVAFSLYRIISSNFGITAINYSLFIMTIILIGVQTIFSTFFLSMMLVEKTNS